MMKAAGAADPNAQCSGYNAMTSDGTSDEIDDDDHYPSDSWDRYVESLLPTNYDVRIAAAAQTQTCGSQPDHRVLIPTVPFA